ncbi:unnamed protein product [Nyctereutes procyonoides]|uniref:(raccoon dog) hypothetical protein n=1 Tax=Nyctereutes procyonoides TaxID=34880 RepID=A0A811ZZR1_NYCPR|nr:unnamed protein product [Nyctereutes procyonoides]
MANQLQGIQLPLQAWKQAREVFKAQEEEEEESQAEIEQYCWQREDCSTRGEKETQEKMTILQIYFQQNRDEVLDNFLVFVTSGQKSMKTTASMDRRGRSSSASRLGFYMPSRNMKLQQNLSYILVKRH